MITRVERSSSWKVGLERFPANHIRPCTLRTKRGSLTGGQEKEQKTSPLALGQSWRTAWRGQALMKQYKRVVHHRALYNEDQMH